MLAYGVITYLMTQKITPALRWLVGRSRSRKSRDYASYDTKWKRTKSVSLTDWLTALRHMCDQNIVRQIIINVCEYTKQ